MFGFERLSSERVGSSKYSTERFASRSSLWEAKRAIPTSGIPYFRLLFALLQAEKSRATELIIEGLHALRPDFRVHLAWRCVGGRRVAGVRGCPPDSGAQTVERRALDLDGDVAGRHALVWNSAGGGFRRAAAGSPVRVQGLRTRARAAQSRARAGRIRVAHLLARDAADRLARRFRRRCVGTFSDGP